MTDREAVTDPVPGLRRMKRGGRVDLYWVATRPAVAAGYKPTVVRLHGDMDVPGEAQMVAQRCRVLTAEMRQWMSNKPAVPSAATGTIAWLCDLYQTDEDSPYRGLRASTGTSYDESIKIIRDTVGSRRIDAITGRDIRRWFKSWGRADPETDILANPRRAYGCIQLLRIVVNFGVESGNRASGGLKLILQAQRFKQPKRRKLTMTREQVDAFILAAHEAKLPSLALAVAIQFSCALRQKDVIGEWLPQAEGGQRWTTGLLWGDHVRPDWTLQKPTSKSNGEEVAEFDLRLLPLVMAELQCIPLEARIGPVVRCEGTGRPWKQRLFAQRFREVARAAGIPDTVWNMDTRAGAVTEAYDKGAREEDAMDLATHKQRTTNQGYNRGRMAKTSRVSALRFGAKNEP